jgi:hypothetical protein
MDYKADARTYRWIASLGCVLSASLLACADEPKPKCTAARGDFAATYTLVSGSGECAQLTGEILGVQAYNAQRSKTDTRPDFNRGSIGIQPRSITDALQAGAMPNSADKPYGLGNFDSAEPASDGFCSAPTLNVARLRHPDQPLQTMMCMTTPAMPAVDIEYKFSDVRVYTTAAALGTQLSAKLTYTKDGCTAKYNVRAVYPAVPCGAPASPPGDASMPAMTSADEDAGAAAAGADEDGGCPPAMPAMPPPGPMVADVSLCSAEADPAHGRPLGSGLSPDYAIRCDPDLLLCVLKHDVPSLR